MSRVCMLGCLLVAVAMINALTGATWLVTAPLGAIGGGLIGHALANRRRW